MSDSEHFSVTYTSIPSLVEDYSDIGSPKVDGPPSPNYAPLSPDYVPGPKEPEQAPLSPDYVPGPKEPEQAPPSPVYLPYVLELVYLEYMPPEDDVFLAKEQPLPEDDQEDPKEDPTDYPVDSTVVALPTVDHVPSEEPYSYRDSRELFTTSEEAAFCFSYPSQEAGESSAAGAARQNEPAVARDNPYSLVREELYGFVDRVDVAPRRLMFKVLDYGITDTWDELVGANEEIAPTTLQGVNQRVTNLSTIVKQETTIMYGMMEDAQDDRSQLRGRVNLLYRDRPVQRRLAVIIEREARMAHEAWGPSMDSSDNAHSDVMSLRTTLVA
nr:hypothetical protein [Tanacetum cinerariifolium]